MEEDTAAIHKKMNLTKPAVPKFEARQEPQQQTPDNKTNQRKIFVYVVNENELSGSKVVVRVKGWNVWDREASSSSSPRSTDLNQWCSYHKSKAHDTRNCRNLVDALFSSYEKGTSNVEQPKPRPNTPRAGAKTKKRKPRGLRTGLLKLVLDPNTQRTTNLTNKKNAKPAPTTSSHTTVDASRSSSCDHVLHLMKNKTM